MAKQQWYDDLFTLSRDARLWSDLYDRPTKLFHHNMSLRRDHALGYALENVGTSGSILDLGCGAGVLLEKVREAGYDSVGVDLSVDMLQLARERLDGAHSARVGLLNAGCEALPFGDEQFDAVFCMGLFGYVQEVDRALSEIRRVLRPGGLFLMSVRNRANEILSDPCRLAGWTARRAARAVGLGRIRRILKPAAGTHPAAGAFHIVIQDSPGNVIRGITARGFTLESFEGFGFGPLSLCGRELLPLGVSIRLNDLLNAALVRMRLASASAWIADVSMFAFRKSPEP